MRKAKFKRGDTVRLLDGKDIPNYSGFWASSMREYIGNETTIEHIQYDKYTNQFRYMVKDNMYVWDERSLELVEFKPNWKVLIAPINGKTTEGRLIEDNKVVKAVTTKKSKEDEYSVEEACKVITERLFEKEESPNVCGFPIGSLVEITVDVFDMPKGARGYVLGKGFNDKDVAVDLKINYGFTHNCASLGYKMEGDTCWCFLKDDLKLVR